MPISFINLFNYRIDQFMVFINCNLSGFNRNRFELISYIWHARLSLGSFDSTLPNVLVTEENITSNSEKLTIHLWLSPWADILELLRPR